MDVREIERDGMKWLKSRSRGHDFTIRTTSHHNGNVDVAVDKPLKLVFPCFHFERERKRMAIGDSKEKRSSRGWTDHMVKVDDGKRQLEIPAGSLVTIFRSYETAAQDEAIAAIFVPAIRPERVYTIYKGRVKTREFG